MGYEPVTYCAGCNEPADVYRPGIWFCDSCEELRANQKAEGDPVKHWSMKAALTQIADCHFVCNGGPLSNNDAWRWLIGIAKVGPEFWPGQGVWFEIEAEAAGKKLRQFAHFYIVGCHMSSDTDGRFWLYDLSYDPPAPYHHGTVHFTWVRGERLALEKPAMEGA